MTRATSILVERRLNSEGVAALQAVVGAEIESFYCAHVYLSALSTRIRTHSLALRVRVEKSQVLSILPEWITTPAGDDFHVLHAELTGTPFGIPVEVMQNGLLKVGPCSWVELRSAFPVRTVRAIEIVSYEQRNEQIGRGEAPVDERIAYDRAVRFCFEDGRQVSVTTQHGPIFGALELRMDGSVDFSNESGTFSSRITLN